MEMFNEAFTRDDVINILAADKANGMASTYAYVPVTVTEAEIQEFYAKIEAIVARAPALSYYFSNYYWWTRDDDDYYDDLISLKLVPTSVMKIQMIRKRHLRHGRWSRMPVTAADTGQMREA